MITLWFTLSMALACTFLTVGPSVYSVFKENSLTEGEVKGLRLYATMTGFTALAFWMSFIVAFIFDR